MKYLAAILLAIVAGFAWDWAGPVVSIPIQVAVMLWVLEDHSHDL